MNCLYPSRTLLFCLTTLTLVGCNLGLKTEDTSTGTTGVSQPPAADPNPGTAVSLTLTAVSPPSGTTSGGTLLTLNGTNFLTGATVTLGGTNCGTVTLVSTEQITCLSPAAVAGTVDVVVENSLSAQPSGTRTATLTNAFTSVAPTLFDLYLGSQTTTSSLVLKLSFNSSTDATSLVTTSDLSATIGSNGLRAFVDLLTQGFMFAGYGSGAGFWNATLNPLTLGSAQNLSGRPTAQISDVLGGCRLPNGNLIAGSYTNQVVAEYSSLGVHVRDLPSLSFYLSDCVASSSGTVLYISDYDADSDEAGLVRKLSFDGTSWTISSSLTVTTFGGATKGAPYSLVLHTNGNLYIPPQSPQASGVRKLIRCTNADLTACQEIGSNWPINYPSGAVEGAVQIPGSDDLLFADNTSIYRYKVADDTMTVIYTLAVAGHDWTRSLHIREAP